MNDYPLILAHGIARFDFLLAHLVGQHGRLGSSLGLSSDGLHYFRGIARHLRSNNFDVHHSSVSFAAPLARRAQDLSDEVQRILQLTAAPKAHIIAHSMGGMDARYMIVRLGMADRVATLTTIGTPHLGTSFADWGLAHEGDVVIAALENVIDLRGFLSLTRHACGEFNESALGAEASNEVFYQAYASTEQEGKVFAPFQPAWKIISREEGDNDGLVSSHSQRWVSDLRGPGGQQKQIAQFEFPVPADHLNEIGWCDLNELGGTSPLELAAAILRYEVAIKNAYLNIAKALAAR